MFLRKGQALGSVNFQRLAELRAERPKRKTTKPIESGPTDTEREADYQAAQSRVDAGLPAKDGDDTKLSGRPGPEQPKDYAPKGDWVAWVVAQGADEAEAEALTKNELIELYGGES